MFCPKCGIENEPAQGFCPKCGLALASIRLAASGQVDRSLKKLQTGDKMVRSGIGIIGILTLIAIVIAALGVILSEASLLSIAFINLLLGLIIALPLIFVGKLRLRQSLRLLTEPSGKSEITAPRQAERTSAAYLKPEAPVSMIHSTATESTTANLRQIVRRSGELS